MTNRNGRDVSTQEVGDADSLDVEHSIEHVLRQEQDPPDLSHTEFGRKLPTGSHWRITNERSAVLGTNPEEIPRPSFSESFHHEAREERAIHETTRELNAPRTTIFRSGKDILDHLVSFLAELLKRLERTFLNRLRRKTAVKRSVQNVSTTRDVVTESVELKQRRKKKKEKEAALAPKMS